MNLNIKTTGLIKLVAEDAQTGAKRVVADWFPNLITDNGLDRLANGSWVRTNGNNLFGTCFVGSGNAAPANSDTSLVSQVAKTSNGAGSSYYTLGNSGAPDYYTFKRVAWSFSAGAAAGNLAEVGFSTTSTDTDLCSRALILDAGGSPTTITIDASEILTVYYELRVYPPLIDFTGTAGAYSYTARSAEVGNSNRWDPGINGMAAGTGASNVAYDGAIGAVTGLPSGASDPVGTEASGSYTPGSYALSYTQTIPISDANFGTGIKSLLIYGGPFAFQVEFDTAINKTSSDNVDLGWTVSWSRATI